MEEKLVEAFVLFTTRGFQQAMAQAKQIAAAVSQATGGASGGGVSGVGKQAAAAAQMATAGRSQVATFEQLLSLGAQYSTTLSAVQMRWTQISTLAGGTTGGMGAMLARLGPALAAAGPYIAAIAAAVAGIAATATVIAKSFASAFVVNREAIYAWTIFKQRVESVFQAIGKPMAEGMTTVIQAATHLVDVFGRIVQRIMSIRGVAETIKMVFEVIAVTIEGMAIMLERTMAAVGLLGDKLKFQRLGRGAEFFGLTDFSKRVQASANDPMLAVSERTAKAAEKIVDFLMGGGAKWAATAVFQAIF